MSAAKKSIATTNNSAIAGRNVAIIGGGLGGLTAALAFAKAGARVNVYEQAAALSEVGAGIQITPNSARALDALGLTDPLSKNSIAAQAVVPTDGRSGKALARFDLSNQSPAYRFFHRAQLIQVLEQAARAQGVQVHCASRIDGIGADGSFSANGQMICPDLTIGADGIHSVVRQVLNGQDTARFTGQVAWRAIIEADTPDPVARIWMLPGRHVVSYPLSDGRLNIVAVQERQDWAEEGWHHPDDPVNLCAAFADGAPALQALLSRVAKVHLWGLFRHPVAKTWENGKIAILGDAAHPTLPFLAQGANLAIEDAYVLADRCTQHKPLPEALAGYKSLRSARVTRAIAAANANARNYHLSGLQRMLAHTGLRAIGQVAPQAFFSRLSWLYDHDVTLD